MKSKKRVWFGLGLLALAATLALWKCAPDTIGSDNYLNTGTILRILKVATSEPCFADGATVVGVDLQIKNDSLVNGADQRTDVTLTSVVLHLAGSGFTLLRNDVLTPGSTLTLAITIAPASPLTTGQYYGNVKVSGINDFGKDVEAKAKFSVCVAPAPPPPPPPPPTINDGPNGICQSTALGDDVQVIPVLQGLPNALCVTDGDSNFTVGPVVVGDDVLLPSGCTDGVNCTGISAGPDGVCNTAALAGDNQVIPVGQGQPNQDCITAGTDGILQTAPGGDDI